MARTIDEITANINNAQSVISSQEQLITAYNATIQANANEIEALRMQHDTLVSTQMEFMELCSTLSADASAIGTNYGTTNGFASDFSGKALEKIEAVKTEVTEKLQGMIDRIGYQISVCETNLSTAQNNLTSAQNQISAAQTSLETYNLELEAARAEEVLISTENSGT